MVGGSRTGTPRGNGQLSLPQEIAPKRIPRLPENPALRRPQQSTERQKQDPGTGYCFALRSPSFATLFEAAALTCALSFAYGTSTFAKSRTPLIPRVR